MIPQRVKLQGFLCYKDEQEVRFDGASLWMLSGLNGSGKSTVFDAVTYALFGYHRAGSRDAIELINKDRDSLTVEFDFMLDGVLHRAKRTLRRNARGGATPTQQVLRRQPGANGWTPLEGTGQKREFEAWVREHIGLDYETFTASVLLLQGKAEKLLDATAKGRFEVLAGIVDLERYERLHHQADEEHKQHERQKKLLIDQLAAIPTVSAEQLAAVEERIAAAETAKQQAEAEVERLHALEYQARQWLDLQARLGVARQRWEQAQRLVADAPAIERDLLRLHELRDVLPRMHTLCDQHTQIRTSEEKSKQYAALKQKLAGQLTEKDNALEQTRQKRGAVQKMIADDEQRQRDVVARFHQAAALLARLKEHDEQETGLARLHAELSRLPADPQSALVRAREACEQLTAVAQVVPLLGRLQTHRDELRRSLAEEQAAQQALQAIRVRGEQRAADLKQHRPKVEDATRSRQQADEQAAEVRALLQQARNDLKEFSQLEGARVCRSCGQPLTASHFQEELARRDKDLQALTVRHERADAARQVAVKHERELHDLLMKLEKSYQEARDDYRDEHNRADRARQNVERLQRDLAQTWTDLPEPFHACVSPTLPADWCATAYPAAEELESLRTQANGLAAARRQLRDEETALQQWQQLKAQEASIHQTLTRLRAELPPDHQAVRQDHTRLDAEQQTLDRSLTARRTQAQEAQKEVDRLTREREQFQQQVADVQGRLSTEEAARRHHQETIDRACKELPASWRPEAAHVGFGELNRWNAERDDLVGKQTEERGRQLQQAQQGLEVLRQDREALEAQQEQFLPEARRDPAEVQALLAQAKLAHRRSDDELGQARQERALLETYRKQREELDGAKLDAARESQYYETLADLLSRKRLQLHLVRQAERQVVDHANTMLDRLSGGQLYLRLCGEAGGDGTTDQALDLEAYNRTTGEKAINVAFLSGSQKFRVAVSLALGIGQYASRQHRPIESVIIDEGFGCLDRQGRQVMIQELQNLRGHLHCILLVSHQEEFAEAFADGYHFELQDGATRVRRFQR